MAKDNRPNAYLPLFGGSFASKALKLRGRALPALKDDTGLGNVKIAPQTIAEAGHLGWQVSLCHCPLALLCRVCSSRHNHTS